MCRASTAIWTTASRTCSTARPGETIRRSSSAAAVSSCSPSPGLSRTTVQAIFSKSPVRGRNSTVVVMLKMVWKFAMPPRVIGSFQKGKNPKCSSV